MWCDSHDEVCSRRLAVQINAEEERLSSLSERRREQLLGSETL